VGVAYNVMGLAGLSIKKCGPTYCTSLIHSIIHDNAKTMLITECGRLCLQQTKKRKKINYMSLSAE